MENVLMQVCRETHNLTKRQVARKLGMTSKQYFELETAIAAMTPEQAQSLEALYNIKADHFLESSRQLELLRTREEIIKQLKEELEQVNHLMESGYEVVRQSKQSNPS